MTLNIIHLFKFLYLLFILNINCMQNGERMRTLSRSHKIRRNFQAPNPLMKSLNHQLSQKYLRKLNARTENLDNFNNHPLMSPAFQQSIQKQNNPIMNFQDRSQQGPQLIHGGRPNTNGLFLRNRQMNGLNPLAGRNGRRENIRGLRAKMNINQNREQENSPNQEVNMNTVGLNAHRKLTDSGKIIKLNAQRNQLKAFASTRERRRGHFFSESREKYKLNKGNQNIQVNEDELKTHTATSATSINETSTNITVNEEKTTITTSTTTIPRTEETTSSAESLPETTKQSKRRKFGSRRQEVQKMLFGSKKVDSDENDNQNRPTIEATETGEKMINLAGKRKSQFIPDEEEIVNQDDVIENLLNDINMQETKTHKDLFHNVNLLKEIDSINLNLDLADKTTEEVGEVENNESVEEKEPITSTTQESTTITSIDESDVLSETENETETTTSEDQTKKISNNEYAKNLRAFASRRRTPNIFSEYRKNLAMSL